MLHPEFTSKFHPSGPDLAGRAAHLVLDLAELRGQRLPPARRGLQHLKTQFAGGLHNPYRTDA